MPFLFTMLLLLPITFAAAVLLNKAFEETVSLVLLGVITAGYVLGLFSLLWLAPYLLYAAVLASAMYLVYRFFFRKDVKIKPLITFGFVAFVVLAALLWWLCRGHMLTFWDDFSHWGLSIKNMYYLDGLYTIPASTATFKDYPPAGPILQYIFLKACRLPFREDFALFIHSLFFLSLLVYPLRNFQWKKIGIGIVAAVLLFILPPAINSGVYTRLLVDGLLGGLLGFILLTYYLPTKTNRLVYLVLGCFVLSITKEAGVGLAALAVLIILIDTFVFKRSELKEHWQKSKLKCVLAFSAPALAVLAGKLSWTLHKNLIGIAQRWEVSAINFTSIARLFSGAAPAYRYEVIRRFIHNFFAVPGNGNLLRFPTVVWFAVYAVLFTVTFLLLKKEKRSRYIFMSVSLVVMHFLYEVIMLLNYLFVFSEGEALALAAVFRYEASIVTACMLFFITVLLVAAKDAKLWQSIAACAVSALCVFTFCADSFTFVHTLATAPTQAAKTQHKRFLSMQSAERVRALGVENPRVFMVSITDDGWALLRLDYELLPMKLHNPDYITSIATGEYYGENTSLGSTIYSPEEWAQELSENYDYVYLHNIDHHFTANYASLFENEADIVNDVMLEVVRHEDGSITLRRLF